MQCWLRQGLIELKSSQVVLVAPNGPRKDFMEQQYFETLYARDHVYYMEMPSAQIGSALIHDVILAVAKHVYNRRIGENILHDPTAMYRDVLGPYAPKALERLGQKASSEEPVVKQCPYHL